MPKRSWSPHLQIAAFGTIVVVAIALIFGSASFQANSGADLVAENQRLTADLSATRAQLSIATTANAGLKQDVARLQQTVREVDPSEHESDAKDFVAWFKVHVWPILLALGQIAMQEISSQLGQQFFVWLQQILWGAVVGL